MNGVILIAFLLGAWIGASVVSLIVMLKVMKHEAGLCNCKSITEIPARI